MIDPTPGSATPGPTLDGAALARLRELDPDGRHGVLPRVLGAFEVSLSRMCGQLRDIASANNGDAAAVAAIAHTLKSSSASVGALALASACTEIERRLRSGAAGDLAADVQHLLAESEAAMQAVGAMLRP